MKAAIAAVHTHVCQPHHHAADASGSLGPHQHHQHDSHQHAPGCGNCFERYAAAAAVEGRSVDELNEAAEWLCCNVPAVADEPACPACEAGMQRQLAREAAHAVLSLHDLLPHVLRT